MACLLLGPCLQNGVMRGLGPNLTPGAKAGRWPDNDSTHVAASKLAFAGLFPVRQVLLEKRATGFQLVKL